MSIKKHLPTDNILMLILHSNFMTNLALLRSFLCDLMNIWVTFWLPCILVLILWLLVACFLHFQCKKRYNELRENRRGLEQSGFVGGSTSGFARNVSGTSESDREARSGSSGSKRIYILVIMCKVIAIKYLLHVVYNICLCETKYENQASAV